MDSQQKLSTYRKRRDFAKTTEPHGGEVRQSERRRFVIQKHDATRLHYDLRLELDGVFKSWAVTKGPSLDPHDKRLAVEVEDHPLDYGDFEGTIPKGQYGGGTVQIWDRGYWAPEGRESAESMLAAGDLKFKLEGERLHGDWVLVHIKRDRVGDKRSNWLLIKHRDEYAREGDGDSLLAEDRSVASGRSMAEITGGGGRGPKPFMLRGSARNDPARIWASDGERGTDLAKAPARSKAKATKRRGRDDKVAGEVETEKSAEVGRIVPRRPASSSKKAPDRPVVMGVTISHPDKSLWPDAGDGEPVSKLDLALYYEAVGDWMLPHIKGRPCSIVRMPDGLGGQEFFQRHASRGTSSLVDLVEPSDDGKPYLEIDRKEALAAMAQSDAVELHPWNCLPNKPDTPGRLVFDLDPGPGVAFAAVVEAAIELKHRLEAVGLVSFCKTTGGKGLHVVTPLAASKKGKTTWPIAKSFAQEICTRMAGDNTKLFVVNMAKKLRAGRIFLDYLRNDRTATAVAPFSPRARAGATVSTPVAWPQVRSDLDPQRFTIRSVPPLLRKSEMWAGYDEAARPLADAVRRLGANA